jgi:hypothetical protein
MTRTDPSSGSTRVRDQPEIRSPRSAMWLIPAAVLGAIAVGMFALNMPVDPVLARIGILLEGALFATMIVVTLARPPQRRLGLWFAGLMLGMAAVALVLLSILAAGAWAPYPA